MFLYVEHTQYDRDTELISSWYFANLETFEPRGKANYVIIW